MAKPSFFHIVRQGCICLVAGVDGMAAFLDCAAVASRVDGRRLCLKFKRLIGKWIYCNYPERLPAAALGDADLGNKYLNRAEVCGQAQLFASYVNGTGDDILFGILLYNPGNATAGVLRQCYGHRHSGVYPDWCDVQGGVWRDFFANTDGEMLAVPPGGSAWIFEQPVPSNKFFNSVVSFDTDQLLHCFVYAYQRRASIGDTATCFPWIPGVRQYRGEGCSYAIETTVGLHVSRMPYQYYTCHCPGALNEMTPIYDPCAAAWRCCSNPDNNLGNWGLHYIFCVVVVNDTNAYQVVRSYIGSDGKTPGASVVIRYGDTVKWCCCNRQEWWNWLVDYLPAGQSRVYRYEFIHAANSTAPVLHGWRLGQG